MAHPVLKPTCVNKLLSAPAVTDANKATGFWARLLQAPSMQDLSEFERLVTGCEIIAALDDLGALENADR